MICYIGVDGAATVIGLKSHNRERETRFSPPSLNRGKARTMARGDTRCIEGRLWRHDPQDDDPYLETERGQCPVCDGKGCETLDAEPVEVDE